MPSAGSPKRYLRSRNGVAKQNFSLAQVIQMSGSLLPIRKGLAGGFYRRAVSIGSCLFSIEAGLKHLRFERQIFLERDTRSRMPGQTR
jgi:hypothetical protein